MRKKISLNPHSLSIAELLKNKQLPPLNQFIKDRLSALNIQVPDIMEALSLSRSKSYLILNGYFPSNYVTRLSLVKLLDVPLDKLILWEYGLLKTSQFPKPKDGIAKHKKEILKNIKVLATKTGLTPERIKRLI